MRSPVIAIGQFAFNERDDSRCFVHRAPMCDPVVFSAVTVPPHCRRGFGCCLVSFEPIPEVNDLFLKRRDSPPRASLALS
jgi:hypothetical protein